MARTRRQEEKLVEKGIPPTPPQQLSTPRRITKVKARPQKTSTISKTRLESSEPAASRTRSGRARTNSASQSDQPAQAHKAAPKRRGRTAKVSRATKGTVEEATRGVPSVLNTSQESTEEDHDVAPLAPSRETLSYHCLASVLLPSSVETPNPHTRAKDLAPPGLALPEDLNSIAERNQALREELDLEKGSTKSELDDLEEHADPAENQLPTETLVCPEYKLKEIMLEALPAFMEILRTHPEIAGNAVIEDLLTTGDISVSIKPSTKKSKTRVALQTVEQTPQNRRDTSDVEKPSEALGDQSNSKRKLDQTEDDVENHSHKRFRITIDEPDRIPVLFDDSGMLSLTAYKEAPAQNRTEFDEESPDESERPLRGVFSQNQQRAESSTETPRSRGWALSSFLPSAQAVSRFLPSFSARTTSAVAPPPPVLDSVRRANPSTPIPSAMNRSQLELVPITPEQAHHPDQSSQSEPRPIAGNVEGDPLTGRQPAATARTSHRHRGTKSKHGLKTKGEREEIKRRDEMIASLRAQLDAQNELQARQAAEAEQAAQAQKEMAAQVDAEMQRAAQRPSEDTPVRGIKRKAESPEVIPNPPGGGFGMVLDYFGQDSDDDEDNGDMDVDGANMQVTPTRPPSKKSRLSGQPTPSIIGDPFRATPYTGSALALPALPSDSSNFRGSFFDFATTTRVQDHPLVSMTSPDVGPTMTFRVPSPSDSDDEWDGPSYHEMSPAPTPSASARVQNVFVSDSQLASPSNTSHESPHVSSTPKQTSSLSSNKLEPTGSIISPPQTTPTKHNEPLLSTQWTGQRSSALQASKNPAVPNVALDKARQTALKHKPQQPSRLREFSRLSSSTIGPEHDEDETTKKSDVDHMPHARETRLENAEARDPYAGRTMTRSLRDPLLLEPNSPPRESPPPMHSDPNTSDSYSSDNGVSDPDIPYNFPICNSYETYIKTIDPEVQAFLKNQFSTDQAQFRAEAETLVNEQFHDYEKEHSKDAGGPLAGGVDPEVQIFIEANWTQADDEAAIEFVNIEFEKFIQQNL